MSEQLNKIVCIIPCFNEEGSLVELVKRLDAVKKENEKKFQLDILLVNDGSFDKTEKIIKELSNKKSYLYYRAFAQNSGHQSALRAGLEVCGGYDAAVMLDADLQHPPKYIPEMINEWKLKQVSIVQMLRKDSIKEVGLLKYATSKGYYWFINKISGLNLEYGSSDFRLVDKSVIKTIALSPEKDLFLRGYFSWMKVKRSTLSYKPDARFAGNSKYTLRKMIELAQRGVLQFSEKPLRLATSLGVFFALVSFIYGLVIIANYFFGNGTVSGWTSMMVVVLFCFSINFILIGFLGRYLAHAIEIQKGRPEYIVFDEKIPMNH